MTRILKRYLFKESEKTGKPIVFLFHPNECLDIGDKVVTSRRTNNPITYVFADVIRHRLKLRNMGEAAVGLLDTILSEAEDFGFEFVNAKEYANLC